MHVKVSLLDLIPCSFINTSCFILTTVTCFVKKYNLFLNQWEKNSIFLKYLSGRLFGVCFYSLIIPSYISSLPVLSESLGKTTFSLNESLHPAFDVLINFFSKNRTVINSCFFFFYLATTNWKRVFSMCYFLYRTWNVGKDFHFTTFPPRVLQHKFIIIY